MAFQWRTRGRAHLLGDNFPHDGGVITQQMVQSRSTDPAELIPHLFENHDPTLISRMKPGDFVVAGRNFGCGKPHISGFLAMQAFGLRVLAESVPVPVARAMMNLGLPCLQPCRGLRDLVSEGDEIEVDFSSGQVIHLATGRELSFRALDPFVRNTIEQGGLKGALLHWLKEHPELGEPAETRA